MQHQVLTEQKAEVSVCSMHVGFRAHILFRELLQPCWIFQCNQTTNAGGTSRGNSSRMAAVRVPAAALAVNGKDCRVRQCQNPFQIRRRWALCVCIGLEAASAVRGCVSRWHKILTPVSGALSLLSPHGFLSLC